MRSSSGAHYIALDHIRALAAFLVFTWHFTHTSSGFPVPHEYTPALFPFALLDEGHTGVSLFMTLSGYLFAKLLDGKSIRYTAFLWNRALRLLPLLAFVVVSVGISRILRGEDIYSYARTIMQGVLLPTLPNGGWSITVEAHYYAVLPLFVWMLRKSKAFPVSIIVAAIALRAALHYERGEIQSLAYWTLIGRIDQFAVGMMAFHFRDSIAGRHALAVGTLTLFAAVYWLFDLGGGFYLSPSYPSPSPVWIILPTLEGLAYALGIAWYESSFAHSTAGVSKFVGRIGEFSYSIYLLHFFMFDYAARFVHQHIMSISNFYLACLWSLAFFALMVPVGFLSFRYLESPFLKLRRPYVYHSPARTPA